MLFPSESIMALDCTVPFWMPKSWPKEVSWPMPSSEQQSKETEHPKSGSCHSSTSQSFLCGQGTNPLPPPAPQSVPPCWRQTASYWVLKPQLQKSKTSPPNLVPNISRCPFPHFIPSLFLFYMPDDCCIVGPFAFEEARKRYDFLMLKKEKKTPFPQDVLY